MVMNMLLVEDGDQNGEMHLLIGLERLLNLLG
jgi:hypothetical protein